MCDECGQNHSPCSLQEAPEAHGAKTIEEKVRQIIDQEIRPALRMDGGDIELVEIKGNDVHVRLQGACAGCPGAAMTLQMGIERRLKELVPEVGRVVPVP